MTAFSGVRSSCDMLARNSLFSRLASWIWRFSASSRTLCRRSSSACRRAVSSMTTPTMKPDSPGRDRKAPRVVNQCTLPSGQTTRNSSSHGPDRALFLNVAANALAVVGVNALVVPLGTPVVVLRCSRSSGRAASGGSRPCSDRCPVTDLGGVERHLQPRLACAHRRFRLFSRLFAQLQQRWACCNARPSSLASCSEDGATTAASPRPTASAGCTRA